MSIKALNQKGEGKRSILPIMEGSAGLNDHCFPLESENIDGIFDVMKIGYKC